MNFSPLRSRLRRAVELLLLAGPQLGPLKLVDLVAQGVHAAGLLRLVHLQGVHLATDIRQLWRIFCPIGGPAAARCGRSCPDTAGAAPRPAAAGRRAARGCSAGGCPSVRSCVTVTGRLPTRQTFLPSGVDLPLQQTSLLIPCDAHSPPPTSRLGHAGETGADVGLVGPGTDQVTGGALDPARRSATSMTMDLPAPVSPVRALKPGSKVISARSMMAIFSIWSNSQHLSSLRTGAVSAQHLLDLRRQNSAVCACHAAPAERCRLPPEIPPYRRPPCRPALRAGAAGQARHGLDDHDDSGR